MVSELDELVEYYQKVVKEVRVRTERMFAIERQIQESLAAAKRSNGSRAPILRVYDLARDSICRLEKLKGLKDLHIALAEAKKDLEMAQQRKLDVLEELQENGISPASLEG